MKKQLEVILKPVQHQLDGIRESIDYQLRTEVPLIREGSMHLFRRGGKMVRGSLVILTSALGGEMPEGTLDIAAATEICHAATLIHDDIIDKSFLRRGDVTLSSEWGNKVAVLVGDFMYTTALDTVVRDGNPRLFPVIVAGTRDMVQGELYQLQYSNVESITKEHYFNIIDLKTARFMAACTQLGGEKAGYDEETCLRLYEFGRKLGMAFQIIDDTLDVASDDQETGKEAGNDLRDGKITLPLLHLMEQDEEKIREVYREFGRNPGPGLWEKVRSMVIEAGGIEYSRDLARDYVEEAQRILKEFPDSMAGKILTDMGNFFVDRSF